MTLFARGTAGGSGFILTSSSQAEGHRQGQARLDLELRVQPKLDPADCTLAEPDHRAQSGLRQVAPSPSVADHSAEPLPDAQCRALSLHKMDGTAPSPASDEHERIGQHDLHRDVSRTGDSLLPTPRVFVGVEGPTGAAWAFDESQRGPI